MASSSAIRSSRQSHSSVDASNLLHSGESVSTTRKPRAPSSTSADDLPVPDMPVTRILRTAANVASDTYDRRVSLESTKAGDLATVIEEAIVSGEIPPGTVLRQEQLSERFGVSRTPVREALRRLAALGLVQFVPNRGVRVRTLSRDELYEAFLVRAELESLATELAATRMTAESIAELGEAERRFERLVRALRAREPGADRRVLTND